MIKKRISFILLSFVMLGFSQCATTKQLEKTAPTEFGSVYFERWVSGIKGGGAGINFFIEVKSSEIILDSVYFRDRVSKLTPQSSYKNSYIGAFITQESKDPTVATYGEDSNVKKEDYLKQEQVKIPFELKPNECVISYKVNGKTKYFKIENVKEKRMQDIPMGIKN